MLLVIGSDRPLGDQFEMNIRAAGALTANLDSGRRQVAEQILVATRGGHWLVTARGVVLQRSPSASKAIRNAIRTASKLSSHQIETEVLIERVGRPASIWPPKRRKSNA
jgi:hypothetical protein